MFLISFLLRNKYQPEESGVDMSTPVHPVVPPSEAKIAPPSTNRVNKAVTLVIDRNS